MKAPNVAVKQIATSNLHLQLGILELPVRLS
jgi:hypothetical protein